MDDRRLKAIKLLHTLVWAGFAGCIVAIPVLTLQERFRLAALLPLIVLGEVTSRPNVCMRRYGWAASSLSTCPAVGDDISPQQEPRRPIARGDSHPADSCSLWPGGPDLWRGNTLIWRMHAWILAPHGRQAAL